MSKKNQELIIMHKPEKTTRSTKEMVSLPCMLDEDRREQVTETLLGGLEDIEDLERKKKAASDEFKEQMEVLESNVKICRKALKFGEEKPVLVETVFDYDALTVTRTRRDTHEQLDTRPMNQDELQIPLTHI